MRGLATILTAHAIVGKGGELAVGMLDRFEVTVGNVDHLLAWQAVGRRQRRDEFGAGVGQVFNSVRANPARQHMLDLSDLAVHHLQSQGDDQRPVTLFHHAVETGLAGAHIDGIDAKASR